MALSVWEVFFALASGGEESEDESSENGKEGRFVPFPLDLSIRIGHGGSDSQRVRELAKISKRAEESEEERLDN